MADKRVIKRLVKKKEELEPIEVEWTKLKQSVLEADLMKQIALRTGVSEDVVTAVCRSQWSFLSKVLREGKFYSFRIKFLGIFGVKNAMFFFNKRLHNYFVRKEERVRGVKPEVLHKIREKEELDELVDRDIDRYATEY